MTNARHTTSTQTQRVLELLRRRASQSLPLNTVELLGATADGGTPIIRLPARINELRDAGFSIETQRAPNRTADYYLRAEPATAPPTPLAPIEPTDLDEQGRLFTGAHLPPHAKPDPLPHREAA